MSLEIDGYTDLIEVGRGGFGIVYRAQDKRFGREVAVKVIRDAGLGKDVLARFERECLALGILSGHPNIVAVYDNGSTAGGEFHLVMEFLGGGSLAQRLAAHGPAAPEDVVVWGVALAGALETAHRSGIVHRDVKPENILFSSYGAPKLVDFGIARMRSAYETRSGFISATLSHAAPEVVAGSPVQPAADVYSLASVLFTALRGRPPFDEGPEDSLAPLIARIAGAAPPDLRSDGIPAEVVAVVERGLAKTADERYADAAEFGRALQDVARSLYGREVVLPIGGAEQTAEAAAVAVETLGTAGTVRRKAFAVPPAPAPTPAVTPVTPVVSVPSRTRRTAVLAVAALVVAALGVWAVVGRGDDGTNLAGPIAMPTVSGLPGGGLPGGVGYSGTEVRTGPLTARRDYAFVGTDRVGSTVELRNTSAKSVTRIWIEVVPKDIAVRVGQVSFAPETTGVIEEDPIVYWKVRLAPGAIRTIAWSATIPAGREQGKELLDDVRAWHAAAAKESSKRVAAAAEGLDGAGITTGTDPTLGAGGQTVTPTAPGPEAGPSLAPGGGAPSVPTGGAPVVAGEPGGPGATTTTGPAGPATTANGKPTITVRTQKSNELSGISYTFAVKDPDGDAWTVRSVTGLPAGLAWSGTRISGTVSHSAATATTNFRTGLGQVVKTVKVTVADARGAVSTASFTWTVVDTHRLMPNYENKWGDGSDGLPNVSHISSQSFTSCYHATAEVDRIAKQSRTSGSVLRYGDAVTYTYYTRDTSAPAC